LNGGHGGGGEAVGSCFVQPKPLTKLGGELTVVTGEHGGLSGCTRVVLPPVMFPINTSIFNQLKLMTPNFVVYSDICFQNSQDFAENRVFSDTFALENP
jgi:hypothetical protein